MQIPFTPFKVLFTMESKQYFILLISCVIINAQLISSVRRTTKIRKIKLPSCRCQKPIGAPCGCGSIGPNPIYNCGCFNAEMCGCQKWEPMEIPSCSLEMPGSYASETTYNFVPETYGFSIITLPYDLSSLDTLNTRGCQTVIKPCGCQPAIKSCACQPAIKPCGCQTAIKPCGCQTAAVQPNIYDFLTYMDISYDSQNAVKLSNYDYSCPCGIPQCGCQIPRDVTVCGCRSGKFTQNLPAIEPVSTVFSGLDRYYIPDVTCGCQLPGKCTCQNSCNCGCQKCGFGCGCGCGCVSGCEYGGKYLREVILQPPFL